MDDNKNLNQTNTDTQNTDDYQKILDEYAASIKPEENSSDTTEKTEENIKLKDLETEANKPNEEQLHLKDLNSLQLEAPDNKSIPAATPKIETPAMTQPLNIEPPISEPTPKVTEPQPTATLPTEPATSETKTPEEIKAQIDKILADDSSSTTNISSIPSNNKSGAKKLFFFSVVIFMLVAAGWIYLLYFYQQSATKNTNNTAISPTPTEIVEEETCELNDVTYKVGESFKSADGCNTCSCQTGNMIACTEMACNISPTISTKSATTKLTITPTKTVSVTPVKTTVTPTKTATPSTKKVTPTSI